MVPSHTPISQDYFRWMGTRKAVKTVVLGCEKCQRSKTESVAPSDLTCPLPILERAWEDISMDANEGLPRSKDCTTIWVVVDGLSKYAHFTALRYPFPARKVAQLFIKEVYRLHGLPKNIASNRNLDFTSEF